MINTTVFTYDTRSVSDYCFGLCLGRLGRYIYDSFYQNKRRVVIYFAEFAVWFLAPQELNEAITSTWHSCEALTNDIKSSLWREGEVIIRSGEYVKPG